jgi:hypothetical protein
MGVGTKIMSLSVLEKRYSQTYAFDEIAGGHFEKECQNTISQWLILVEVCLES